MDSSFQLQRIGMAGMLRGFVAGILGCVLWVGAMVVYITSSNGAEGEASSLVATVLLLLISGAFTALPSIASQITRGRWELEEFGVHERITPLVSFLPFGLSRERLVRWEDIERFGVKEMRMRGGRVLHYFRAYIKDEPRIEIARKDRKDDPQFDAFVAEISRRMGQ